MITIDGTNLILGRASTFIAKSLLNGEEVHLINAEKMVMSGTPSNVVERYMQKRRLQNKGTPERSPTWPKVPHMLVKRMIRGMLPRESSRGKVALKRLMVFTGNPKNEQGQTLETAQFKSNQRSITIARLCELLGHTK